MKSLQRILETILQVTALSMVAACSNPEPKKTLIIEVQPPIAERQLSIHKTQPPIVETQLRMYKTQPVAVVIPKSKQVKHCGIDLKPRVYSYPGTDPIDEFATRQLVCLSFSRMRKYKLKCGSMKDAEARTMLRARYGFDLCGGYHLSTTPDVCGPIKVKGQGCCYAMNVR